MAYSSLGKRQDALEKVILAPPGREFTYLSTGPMGRLPSLLLRLRKCKGPRGQRKDGTKREQLLRMLWNIHSESYF
jgi:hypothetical protein